MNIMADALREVQGDLPHNLRVVVGQKTEKEKDNETEILKLVHGRIQNKKDTKLTDDEQAIVDKLVLDFISPVKRNPWLVNNRSKQLLALRDKKGDPKWSLAINATLSSFNEVKMQLRIHAHYEKYGTDNLEWWKELLKEKEVKFPHFYYIFHPPLRRY